MTDLVARPIPIRSFGDLNDVSITSIADGEIIVWDSGTSLYINQTLAEAGIAAASHTHTASQVTDFSTAADARIAAASVNALSDVTITSAASGEYLRHNGTAWVDASIQAADLPVMVGDSGSGGTKGAVPAPSTGDATKFLRGDGTWVTVSSGAAAIDDLTDVTITAAASGDFLRHNGTAWVDTPLIAADLPAMVGDSGSGGTKGAVPAPAAGDAAANKFLKADGTWAVGGGGASALDDLSDVVITAAASGDFIRHNGTNWVDATIVAADLPAMVGDSGSGGTKGAAPAPGTGDAAAGKFLKADGTWAVPSGGSGSSHWHDPVYCATTANVSLSGGGIANGTTHDGITVSTGQRILVRSQSSTTENGIYVVPASGAASRASDMAAAANASGDSVNIIAGTLYADYTAVVTSNSSVVDTDPITIGMVDNGLTAITANYVNAGPASGSAAVPSYRALVPADIPTAVQSEWTNKLINPMFRTWGHAITSPVTITDGAYSGPTGWFFLTQNTSVEITSGSGLSNSSHSVIITNQNASSRRAGTSQFVEYYDTLSLRGKTVTFSIKAKCSNAKNVRAALINWTGTANAPTKDVVNDWASTTYTEGNFFISSGSLDIIAVSSAVSVGTSATEITVTGAVGASTTNLQVIVWTEDALAEDQTIELSEAMLVKGSYSVEFDAPYYPQEMIDCEYRCRTVASDASQTDAIIGWGHGASTTVAVCQVPLGHGMRVVPSLTYTAADWQVADSVGSRQDVTALAISTTVSSRKILFLTSTVASGLTVGRGMATVADTTSGRFLKFDAEIGV